MGKQVKVIALIEEEQRKRLYHVLLDDGLSYAEWLRRQIDQFLEVRWMGAAYGKAKEPKAKRRKGKEA